MNKLQVIPPAQGIDEFLSRAERKVCQVRRALQIETDLQSVREFTCEAYIVHACQRVVEFVCRHMKVSKAAVFSKRRGAEYVTNARHTAMFFCLDPLITGISLSLKEVGRFFGKDHGTIINARRCVMRRLACQTNAPGEKTYRLMVGIMQEKLRSQMASIGEESLKLISGL